MADIYHNHPADQTYIDCLLLAERLGCGYTAEYFYNMELEKLKIYYEFAEVKLNEEKQQFENLKNRRR